MKLLFLLLLFYNNLSSFNKSLQEADNNYEINKLSAKLQIVLQRSSLKKEYSSLNKEKNNPVEEKHSVIVYTESGYELKRIGFNINAVYPKFVTASLSQNEIYSIARNKNVSYLTSGEILYPTNDIASATIGANLLNSGYVNGTQYKGNNVLICIIDSGIDWSHLDFRDPVNPSLSRILYIWDQTLNKTGAEKTPFERDNTRLNTLNYGVEYTKEDIQNEIADGPGVSFVREMDTFGHGTHIAGSAAGNGASLNGKFAGIAPEADLIIVKAGNNSFGTNDIINGLAYAQDIADQLERPIVVNLSLGGHENAHDGTSELDQVIDEFTSSAPGRIVVTSAGNDGNNYIHTTGTIIGRGTSTITFSLPTYTAKPDAENDCFGFNLWFNNNSDVTSTITSPSSLYTYTRTAETQGILNSDHGSISLSNTINPVNTNREIALEIIDIDDTKKPAEGTWNITIQNNSDISITYHGWVYLNTMKAILNNGDNNYSISSPGTARNAITVGSFATRWYWYGADNSIHQAGTINLSDNISSFSSIGPTRDGRLKPDCAAPGQRIISCRSSGTVPLLSNSIPPSNLYFVMQGTSMASSFASGSIALLLQQNPTVNYHYIRNILQNDCYLDNYTGSTQSNIWGYGKLNIFKAMISSLNSSLPKYFYVFNYDQWGTPAFFTLTPSKKFAIKFTPNFTGTIAGVFFHSWEPLNLSGPLYFQLWSDNSGLPGEPIGNEFSVNQNLIGRSSWNFVDLYNYNLNVIFGTNYHLVSYITSPSSINFAVDNFSLDNKSSVCNNGNWTLNNAFDYRMRVIVTPNLTSLPVEISSFTSKISHNDVLLNWRTSTETNNFGFDIERSITNTNVFKKIGFISGSGNSSSPKDYSFMDKYSRAPNRIFYRLKQIDNDGNFKFSDTLEVDTYMPVSFFLYQNHPNPFNPITTIEYEIPEFSKINLTVFNSLGQKLINLVDDSQEPGRYSLIFDASKYSSGIYYYVLDSGNYHCAKKMLIIK